MQIFISKLQQKLPYNTVKARKYKVIAQQGFSTINYGKKWPTGKSGILAEQAEQYTQHISIKVL